MLGHGESGRPARFVDVVAAWLMAESERGLRMTGLALFLAFYLPLTCPVMARARAS